MELYYLSSIPYIHDNTDHDVVEIIPGKHLNYPTAMEFYKTLAEQLKQKSGDDEALLKAAGIYRLYLDDKESAEELAAFIEENYPDCEVEVQSGGQPLYYYIISVE